MPLFQDEPEELPKRPAQAPGTQTHRRLFAPEPEEAPRCVRARSSKQPVAALVTGPTLFGDEPEEQQHASDGSVSSDEGEGPLQSTFNFDFSAMKLFAQTRLLEKTKGVTTVANKKRPYDNSKRSESAAGTSRVAYKDVALDPKRLQLLSQKPQCKCFLANACQNQMWLSIFTCLHFMIGLLLSSLVPHDTEVLWKNASRLTQSLASLSWRHFGG